MFDKWVEIIDDIESKVFRRRRGFNVTKDSVALIFENKLNFDYNSSINNSLILSKSASAGKISFFIQLLLILHRGGFLEDDDALNRVILSKILDEATMPNLNDVPLFGAEGNITALEFYRQYYPVSKTHEGHIELHDPDLAKALGVEGAYDNGAVRSLKQVVEERKALIAMILQLPEEIFSESGIVSKIAAALGDNVESKEHRVADAEVVRVKETGKKPAVGSWVKRVVEIPPLPDKAPARWKELWEATDGEGEEERNHRGETKSEFEARRAQERLPSDSPVTFIRRHYSEFLGPAGRGAFGELALSRSDIRQLDPELDVYIRNWMKKNNFPEDFDLPTKKEMNDRRIAAFEAGDQPKDATFLHRLGAAARYRERKM